MSAPELAVAQVDLASAEHAQAVLELLDQYARDPMGAGAPLSERVRRELLPALREHPTTLVLVAWLDDEPIGLAVCFRGFSSFAARPLLNLHDFFVVPAARRRGVARRLLEQVAQVARRIGCSAITLEVRADNGPAQRLYRSVGFAGGSFGPESRHFAFWRKDLAP